MPPMATKVIVNYVPVKNGQELQTYEIDNVHHLYEHGLRESWYWYSAGSYDGEGVMIMQGVAQDGSKRWSIVSLCHCSCYGPTDGIKFDVSDGGSFDSFESLRTQYVGRDAEELFKEIESRMSKKMKHVRERAPKKKKKAE